MKKKLVLSMALALSLALAACGSKSNETPAEVKVVEPEAIETVTEEPEEVEETEEEEVILDGLEVIKDRPTVDGKKQSYLTGEWKDEDVVNRRNIAIMIPNDKAALPQYGISLASIIYEAPVEGRITRLMGVFEDYDDIDRIGPVRSSRDYYVYEAMAFDSIYVNWGLAVPYVSPIINTDAIDNVSQSVTGIDVPSPEAFDRVSRSGYSKEYTGYLFIDGFNQAVERLGYATEYREKFEQTFLFAQDHYRASYDDKEDATLIYPGGTDSNSGGYGSAAHPYFEYNPEDHLYYRYEYGGPQKDEYNDEQLAVSNVVFKVCHGEVRDDHDYLAFGVIGNDECYVFTNGKVIKGTWSRESNYKANRYYDEDGNEIVLNQGKTWVCNIWKEYSKYISYE
ncbi:MAG: DUF3048 domain-containing protein [Lachnospiraceae bacterium]|nr:DUF3048 domain-containing protein [Lachnospiraceae bacterium]